MNQPLTFELQKEAAPMLGKLMGGAAGKLMGSMPRKLMGGASGEGMGTSTAQSASMLARRSFTPHPNTNTGQFRMGTSQTTPAGWASADPAWGKHLSASAPAPVAAPTPRGPLNLSNIRPQYSMNPQPFGMKMAAMNFVANAINEERIKQAIPFGGTLSSALESMKGMAGRGMERGFGAIGGAAAKLNPEGMASSILAGPNVVSKLRPFGDQIAPEDAVSLGKSVAGRVGIGAGVELGGTLAAEAPVKMYQNYKYNQQQQHPLRSWIMQHMAGAPKLHGRSYLNPFSV
jgi:hypothetical protein